MDNKIELISQPKISSTEMYLDELGIPTVDFFVRGISGSAQKGWDDDISGSEARREAHEREREANAQNGAIVGFADVRVFSHPRPVVYLRDLETRAGAENQRIASMLMRSVEKNILDKGAFGILQNYIYFFSDNSQKARGMHERHGWVSLDGSTMVFNIGALSMEQARTITNKILAMYREQKRDLSLG